MGWEKVSNGRYELITKDNEKYTIVTTHKGNWTGKKRYENYEAHLIEDGILGWSNTEEKAINDCLRWWVHKRRMYDWL